MVLAGRPKDPSYVQDLKILESSMHSARERLNFPKRSSKHRRGLYHHLSTGISYGGGSKVSLQQSLRRAEPGSVNLGPWRSQSGQRSKPPHFETAGGTEGHEKANGVCQT